MTGTATIMTKPAAPETPVVDLDRITAMYTELKKMEVKLDPNPIEYGPKRFNNKIAQVRALLNRVEQVFLQTSEDLHYFKRIINAKRTLYELEKRDLMINDPKCRVGRSQGEREALADVQLRDELEILATLELAAQDLETLMVSIKSRRTDLKNAQSRMRDQMKLLEHDLSMGARWGSSSGPSGDTAGTQELDTLLMAVDNDMGITEDEDDEEDDESPTEDESETEEEEEAIVDDAKHDPAPHAEPEPVLVFGEEEPDEEMEAKEDETAEEGGLIPTENAEGTLPEIEHSIESVDGFLDALDNLDAEDEGEVSVQPSTAADEGIEDLIASFADD